MRRRLRCESSTYRELGEARARLAARDQAIVQTQIAVAEIAAPTGEEYERATWVARRFAALGLADVHVDEAGNAVGRRLAAAPTGMDVAPVVVCAHLDTVFPRETDVRVRRDGNRLVGPGINDNGRGLAVMLALAEEIDGIRVRVDRPVEFVATTGEEGAGNLRGAKHYFETRGDGAAAMVALDGAGDERIVHRALGSRRLRVEYRGVGGHSWAAFGVPNAVHAAAITAARLAALDLPATPRTTVTVGRIQGGIAVNAIPEHAWLEVDLRSTDSAMLDRYEQEIRLAARAGCDMENARSAGNAHPLTYSLHALGSRPCGETAGDHPLVRAAVEITRAIGRTPDLSMASTDANVPISRGIPAIAIGAGGRGGDAHTQHEWFDNREGSLGIGRALAIVHEAGRLAPA